MKKGLILLGLLCLLLASCTTKEDSRKRVAIITIMSHPSLERQDLGFTETLDGKPVVFKRYNAQGNKNLLRGQIEEIARQDYDLVFAICASPAKMLKETFNKKGIKTPIVYASVIDPVSMNLIESEQASENQLTGTIEVSDYQKLLDATLPLIPSVHNILLVYNPTDWKLDEYRQEIEKITAQKGLKLTTVEIFKTQDIMTKVPSFMQDTDAVLILKDNTVVSGLDGLIKLCRRYKVPLIASDLDSFNRGATFAFGVDEYDYGKEAAYQAEEILFEGKSPSEIPSKRIDNFQFKGGTQ